jgi:hypothetical protein
MKRVIAILVATLWVTAAQAQSSNSSNQTLNVQGILRTNAGDLQSMPVGLVVSLYPMQTGGTAFYSQTYTTVPVENGFFSVEVAGQNLAFTAPDVWVGIQVAGDAMEMPRQHLTAVPYCFQAASATVANSLAPASTIDASQVAGTTFSSSVTTANWQTPPLLNNWKNYDDDHPSDAKYNKIGYYKDALGIVRLRGLMDYGGSAIIFTLPAGYLPAARMLVFAAAYNNTGYVTGRIDIDPADGSVAMINPGASVGIGWISLDNISFKAEK